MLWKKRIMEYLYRRNVNDEVMQVDVLSEACTKSASDYLGSLEWPINTVDSFWEAIETRFAKPPLARMAEYD